MQHPHDSLTARREPFKVSLRVLLVLIIAVGAFIRLRGLGTRSLWVDELSTWHVSRMPLADSLQWEPELTIPPLYQFALRLMTDAPHPPEWLLRLPALIAGILIIPATWWLARQFGDAKAACAAAGLAAVQGTLLTYSQEARPYTMLVAGCTLSMALWYRAVTQGRRADLIAYVVITVLAIHAHYLAVLTVAAQVLWWAIVWAEQEPDRRSLRPLMAVIVVGLLCVPVVTRPMIAQASVSRAIGWLVAPTWHGVWTVLEQLGFGTLWLVGAFVLSLVAWFAGGYRRLSDRLGRPLNTGVGDPVLLLLCWFVCIVLGLVILSWALQPMFVLRYALPAAIPVLLLPMIVVSRLHPRAPLGVVVLFAAVSGPQWITFGQEVDPGFRELTTYVEEALDPASTAVVLTMDAPPDSSWAAMERLATAYYPIEDRPVYELYVPPRGKPAQIPPRVSGRGGNEVPSSAAWEILTDDSILRDPRALYLIVFRARPEWMIQAAGRRLASFRVNGVSYSKLLFSPYRLVKVAPMSGP